LLRRLQSNWAELCGFKDKAGKTSKKRVQTLLTAMQKLGDATNDDGKWALTAKGARGIKKEPLVTQEQLTLAEQKI
jgi:hypothetical protein